MGTINYIVTKVFSCKKKKKKLANRNKYVHSLIFFPLSITVYMGPTIFPMYGLAAFAIFYGLLQSFLLNSLYLVNFFILHTKKQGFNF